MGILSIFQRPAPMASATRDPSDDFWYTRTPGVAGAAGAPVTVSSALAVPIVYDCCNTWSKTVATLPLHIYAVDAQGKTAQKARNHPLYDVIHRQPNVETTAAEFWGQTVFDLATHGNAFAEKLPGTRGPVDQLVRICPDVVRVQRLSDGSKRYEVQEQGRPIRYLLDDEVFHLKLMPHSSDGLVGTSPIEMGREVISSLIALQSYGARFFANDATPPFFIQHPGNFKDAESKKNFLEAFKRWFGGRNRGSPAVLEHGMEVKTVGTDNEKAQFLETRKQLNEEACHYWSMKLHKVNILDHATFSNIEHQALEFVTDTILPIVKLIEQAISRDLLIAPQKFYAEFNLDGLLRGDMKSRYEAYAIGRTNGFLSANEIRAKENMNAIAGGDTYLQPLNMAPANAAPDQTTQDQTTQDQTPPGGSAVADMQEQRDAVLSSHH